MEAKISHFGWQLMKLFLVVLVSSCTSKKQSEYHPIIYTSEWACEQERLAKVDSIAKLSAAIDTLIARRDRLQPSSTQWHFYNNTIRKLAHKSQDTSLSKYVLDYQARRLGINPAKLKQLQDARNIRR